MDSSREDTYRPGKRARYTSSEDRNTNNSSGSRLPHTPSLYTSSEERDDPPSEHYGTTQSIALSTVPTTALTSQTQHEGIRRLQKELDALRREPTPEMAEHNPLLDHISHLPMFDHSFKLAEQSAMEVTVRVNNAIDNSQRGSSAWFNLERDAKNSTPYISKPFRVGFAGNTGQGKSLAVGMILGNKGLIQESNSGQSCTRVPIEYYYAPETEESMFTATIEALSLARVVDRVERCFWPLYYSVFPLKEKALPCNAPEKLDVAKSLLRALFRDRPGCKDESSMMSFIGSEKDSKCLSTLEKMRGWGDERLRELQDCKYPATVHARTTEELWKQLMPFTH
ncbi:hypothetical protein BDV95DRAFT_590444 [Massariosphaeria phaeospora]|uniref:P-loop containing nucleoside triphosphate hydrolase protein n=1 Tax=Massariosphaeria phaeospora TaxID=100035 RepID=A0A7C8MVV5_9PLEO|nr:hypothetical protein BDV95DRAFT_590444 [Massariosphaeria phaeospora]